MNQVRILAAAVPVAALLILAACAGEVERPSTPPPTAPPPTLTPRPVVSPTPLATAVPTVPTSPGATSLPTATPQTPPRPTTGPPTVAPLPQLFLDVQGPADGSTVRGDAVVIFGVASPGASLTVNGRVAAVGNDGGFQEEVQLSPGSNTVEVVATDSRGGRETAVLSITSLALPPQPFLLLVTEPRDQSIVFDSNLRLSGRTGSEAIVSINGVAVPVDLLGNFTTTITLESGPNIIDVVATNTDGQVLSTVVAVIYRR